MSCALAVVHGRFGRATLYRLNRPFNLHAHREGHLIFHVSGTPAHIDVGARRYLADQDTVLAVNPWEPHNFLPNDIGEGAVYFVLYVNAEWFAPLGPGGLALRFGRTRLPRSGRLDQHVRRVAASVSGAPSLVSLDSALRDLISACHDASWRGGAGRPAPGGLVDFRVRKSLRLIDEGIGGPITLDRIARESGLSRPHFYKLFRSQVGVTPNLYWNTLRMERALAALVAGDAPVCEIGFDLGFSSHCAFTRFFAGNVGMAPTDYRRAAKILN